MNKLVVITIVLTVATSAMATNNVQSFLIKHGPTFSYPNPAVNAAPPPQAPTSYRYDVRFNPLKYGYSPPAPVAPAPVYSAPPAEYVLPQPVPTYVTTLPAPAPFPAPAPAPTAYLPPHVLAHLEAHARQFIGRHFPHPYRH